MALALLVQSGGAWLLQTAGGSAYVFVHGCALVCLCVAITEYVCVAFTHWMSFHFLEWDKCLFFLAWLAFLCIAFGSKSRVSHRLFLLGLCLPSTILVWAHLVYIRYLFCFSPHCNKPKCCTVHLPNTLRNGRDHSGISPLWSPWQPPDSFSLSYSCLSFLHLFGNSLFMFNL